MGKTFKKLFERSHVLPSIDPQVVVPQPYFGPVAKLNYKQPKKTKIGTKSKKTFILKK